MNAKVLLASATILYILLIKYSIVFASQPEIYAEGAVLIDAKTGVVIYDKDMHGSYYPASITKIMTTLLAIENCVDDERVYMSRNAVFGIERGSSHIAMDADETLSMQDALYGIMLASANEVSMAVAEHIGGDIETFAGMMTARAEELGSLGTNFVNPHGLHSPQHYTTPYDMAQIMRKAITYEEFTKIISTKSYRIPPTEKQPLERPLNNHHKMIQPGAYYYEYAIGGKTGYTDESRNTLVTYAVKDGIELIAVIMRSGPNITYDDTRILFDYGFNMYHLAHVFDRDAVTETRPVGALSGEAVIVPSNSLTLKVPNFINEKNVTTQIELPETLADTITVGDTVGRIIILYDGAEIGETDLIVDRITPIIKEDKPEEKEIEPIKQDMGGQQAEGIAVDKENVPRGGIKLWQISLILLTVVLVAGAGVYTGKIKIVK